LLTALRVRPASPLLSPCDARCVAGGSWRRRLRICSSRPRSLPTRIVLAQLPPRMTCREGGRTPGPRDLLPRNPRMGESRRTQSGVRSALGGPGPSSAPPD